MHSTVLLPNEKKNYMQMAGGCNIIVMRIDGH